MCSSPQASATPTALGTDAARAMCQRLADLPDLTLPAHKMRALGRPETVDDRRLYLQQLLRAEPSIFLERHGSCLTAEELDLFHLLSGDYEVGFWLKSLLRQRNPPDSLVKNRRFAQMNKLLADGTYFSDAAMRQRQPVLYHQLVGQYQPASRPGSGCTLSESLLHQHDELEAQQRLQTAQQKESRAYSPADVMEEAEEEEEEEEEEDDGVAFAMKPGHRPLEAATHLQKHGILSRQEHAEPLSQEELQENHEELVRILQAQFLDGKDEGVNYEAIDQDQLGLLDELNAEEADRDLLEHHFDAVD